MPVRGLNKTTCVVLLFALAHNLMYRLALALLRIGLGNRSLERPALASRLGQQSRGCVPPGETLSKDCCGRNIGQTTPSAGLPRHAKGC